MNGKATQGTQVAGASTEIRRGPHAPVRVKARKLLTRSPAIRGLPDIFTGHGSMNLKALWLLSAA